MAAFPNDVVVYQNKNKGIENRNTHCEMKYYDHVNHEKTQNERKIH